MHPAPASTNRAATAREVSPTRRALSWGVHLFTASGALIGVVALLEIANGHFASAALLMLAAFAIDAVDGSLARAVGAARALPRIDGRRLDDIVDFENYAVVPVVFMVAAGSLPHWSWAALPIVASCYGFSQVHAKTRDDFFLGFPSYWNIVAIYAWALGVAPTTGAVVVTAFSILVFVPLKYVYPSRMSALRTPTIALGWLWTLALVVCVLCPERFQGIPLLQISLAYPVYYFAISLWLGGFQREPA